MALVWIVDERLFCQVGPVFCRPDGEDVVAWLQPCRDLELAAVDTDRHTGGSSAKCEFEGCEPCGSDGEGAALLVDGRVVFTGDGDRIGMVLPDPFDRYPLFEQCRAGLTALLVKQWDQVLAAYAEHPLVIAHQIRLLAVIGAAAEILGRENVPVVAEFVRFDGACAVWIDDPDRFVILHLADDLAVLLIALDGIGHQLDGAVKADVQCRSHRRNLAGIGRFVVIQADIIADQGAPARRCFIDIKAVIGDLGAGNDGEWRLAGIEIAPLVGIGDRQVAGGDMLVVVKAEVLAEIDQGSAAIGPLVGLFRHLIQPVDRADRIDLAGDEVVERIRLGNAE